MIHKKSISKKVSLNITRLLLSIPKKLFVSVGKYAKKRLLVIHINLLGRSKWYANLKNSRLYRMHGKYSLKIAMTCWVILLVLGIYSISRNAYALNNWTQTDWSGGVGASTSNQYSNESNVNTSTLGEAKMTQTSGWSATYSSWKNRQKITIANTGSVQSNYPTKLTISYDSDMKSDFSDIRFTNSSGTALSYWLENKTDSSSATAWVKVDSLTGGGTTDIYMYYGNGSATTESNGNNVFQLFDDFNSGSVDTAKWDFLGTGSSYFTIESNKLKTNDGGNWDAGLTSKMTFPRSDLAITYDLKWTSNNPSYDAFMFGWHDSGTNAYYGALTYAFYNPGADSCTTNCQGRVYEKGSNRASVDNAWTRNVDYKIRIRMRAGGGAYYERSTDGGQNWTNYYTSSAYTDSNLKVGFSLNNGVYEIDNIRVSPWINSEPTSSFDSKQIQYPSSGTLTSAIYDGSIPSDWQDLTYNASTPSGTGISVKVRTGNAPDLSDAPTFSSCPDISSGSDSTSVCAPDKTRYAQYQVILTGNSVSTSTLQEVAIDYEASDVVSPTTNASAVLLYKSNGGNPVASNGWVNSSPYFSWTAGADNSGGSGIKGYCLYVGTDNTADLQTTKGFLGTSPLDTDGACQFAVSTNNIDLSASGILGSSLVSSNASYYLLIKTIDNANNVYAGSAIAFQFRFDNAEPSNPAFISAPSQFVSNKAVPLTWNSSGSGSASDANSGVAGLQYRIGSSGTWYGDTHNGNQDASDLLANDGLYTTQDPPDFTNLTDGDNIVYFRTWDNAGNIATAQVTTAIKINTTAPSSPQNITASPSSNTTNSFAFSWLAPASFTGSTSNITYCYTVNTLPTATSCTFTNPGITNLPAGAYATQPGINTFYVVAKDESGNINYATAASVTFTANTTAPGIPLNASIADISVKATSNWKLAISWEEPTNVGAGVASYKVLRSTGNNTFSEVASTSGTSHVDSGLSQQVYYYKIKACDSANNCGGLTNEVSLTPTGKFTDPANLISEPSVSDISTKRAKITWVTDRESDSKVAIGKSSDNYSSSEIGDSSQVTNHVVNLDNLEAGTTYYIITKWTDEDGNTGTSQEITFQTSPAPVVKDVKITKVTLDNASIKFTTKDTTKAIINFGKTDAFGGRVEVNTSLSESTYNVELPGLDDGSNYVFRITLIDGEHGQYPGDIYSFTTPPRPRIMDLRFQPVKDEPTSTQMVTWRTNVPASSGLSYGKEGSGEDVLLDPKLTTEHKMIMRGLVDNSNYSLVAQSRDKDGNLATSDRQSFKTALDTRPPKIANIKTEASIRGNGAEARGQIVVSWTTDEPSSSQVAYSEGSNAKTLDNRTVEDSTLGTEHIVIVSDLPTSKVYTIQPISQDSQKNSQTGEMKSVIVGRASDSVLTIVLNTLRKIFGI